MKMLIILVSFLVIAQVHAGTLYKSVGPDGKILYSDQPPATGKVVKQFDYSDLPSSPVPPSANRGEVKKDADVDASKRQASASGGRPKLFMAHWCGYCRKAKAYLAEKNISYEEIDIDTPAGKSAFDAIGRSGIPVLLRNGQRVQGFSREAYDSLFSAAR